MRNSNDNNKKEAFAAAMILFAASPFIALVSHQNDLVDAMTSHDAAEATDNGMMRKLSPYFTTCQQNSGIVAGAQYGVTRGMLETMEACLFRAHENDEDNNFNLSNPRHTEIAISISRNAEEAVKNGLNEELSPYFAQCQEQKHLNLKAKQNISNADAEELEACLFTSYEQDNTAHMPNPS